MDPGEELARLRAENHRLQAENDELRARGARRAQAMIDQAMFSIQLLEPDGTTRYVNRAFEELWGLTLDQLKIRLTGDETLGRDADGRPSIAGIQIVSGADRTNVIDTAKGKVGGDFDDDKVIGDNGVVHYFQGKIYEVTTTNAVASSNPLFEADTVITGEGSDIADPDSSDVAYAGTPIKPLQSLLLEGVAPIADRYGEIAVPLRLFTSRHDHVVDPADSEYLAATYAGPVEHTWLERSYHVATRDYDRDLIVAESLAFVSRVFT